MPLSRNDFFVDFNTKNKPLITFDKNLHSFITFDNECIIQKKFHKDVEGFKTYYYKDIKDAFTKNKVTAKSEITFNDNHVIAVKNTAKKSEEPKYVTTEINISPVTYNGTFNFKKLSNAFIDISVDFLKYISGFTFNMMLYPEMNHIVIFQDEENKLKFVGITSDSFSECTMNATNKIIEGEYFVNPTALLNLIKNINDNEQKNCHVSFVCDDKENNYLCFETESVKIYVLITNGNFIFKKKIEVNKVNGMTVNKDSLNFNELEKQVKQYQKDNDIDRKELVLNISNNSININKIKFDFVNAYKIPFSFNVLYYRFMDFGSVTNWNFTIYQNNNWVLFESTGIKLYIPKNNVKN